MITRTNNMIAEAFCSQAQSLWSPFATSQAQELVRLQSEPLAVETCTLELEGFEAQGYQNHEDKNYDHKNSGYFAPPIAPAFLSRGSCF